MHRIASRNSLLQSISMSVKAVSVALSSETRRSILATPQRLASAMENTGEVDYSHGLWKLFSGWLDLRCVCTPPTQMRSARASAVLTASRSTFLLGLSTGQSRPNSPRICYGGSARRGSGTMLIAKLISI